MLPIDVVHNEAFNVGRNEDNYRIRELADIVKETVPNTVIEYAADAGPDQALLSRGLQQGASPRSCLRFQPGVGCAQGC